MNVMSIKIKKQVYLIAGTLIISALIVGTFIFLGGALESFKSKELPAGFLKSYNDASVQSKKIVELARTIKAKINQVNQLDQEGSSQAAFSLINEARRENSLAQDRAIELSSYLEEMVNMITAIESRSVQQIALHAIIIETNLIQEFLEYTQEMDKFLGALGVAVATDSFGDRLAVEERLRVVNKRTERINILNSRFLATIGNIGL